MIALVVSIFVIVSVGIYFGVRFRSIGDGCLFAVLATLACFLVLFLAPAFTMGIAVPVKTDKEPIYIVEDVPYYNNSLGELTRYSGHVKFYDGDEVYLEITHYDSTYWFYPTTRMLMVPKK